MSDLVFSFVYYLTLRVQGQYRFSPGEKDNIDSEKPDTNTEKPVTCIP